jgi:hypothetical protein
MKRRTLIPLAAGLLAASTFCGFTATAQTPALAELLEKGIYAEETKGDLDGAIALYQQLVNDAKANQRLAAQAQFRLASCLLKKNRNAEAAAAFEKLIKEFPAEKELIAKAREHVPGDLVLGPVPWADGEEMQLAIKVANGLDIGTTVYRARSGEIGGKKTWIVGARLFAKVHSFSWVEADAATFKPIRARWSHGMLGDVTVDYRPNEAELKFAGQAEAKTSALDGTVYDNEQVVHLIRRLPLANGYKTPIPVFSSLGGGTVIPIGMEVKATETVKTKAGTFECFKVDLTPVNQSFWFSTDAKRTLVKFGGGGISAELVSTTQRPKGEPVKFEDASMGISLAAPADWVIHHQDPDNDPDHASVYLLDPEGVAESFLLRLHAMSSLSDEQKKSARAWAEATAKKLAVGFKDLKVREDSWKDVMVSGRPGIGFTADYVENDKAMVLRCVSALGTDAKGNAEQFTMAASKNKFDSLQPAFESVLGSYKAK